MRLVVWGAGELGGRVGHAWVKGGESVIGLTQSTKRHDALRTRGIEPRVGDASTLLTSDDALLLALPGSTRQQTALTSLTPIRPPARAVLISSTGYYGSRYGRVDEHTAPGSGAHAAAIQAAELAFRTWAGTRGVILRLGGLYCRGRGPLAALLRRGAAPPGPPDRTLALIHYADAALAALAALRHPAPQPTYIGVVPPCPTRYEFYRHACQVAGLPAPTFSAARGLPLAQFDVTCLQRDLLPKPLHPDWHDALCL